MENNGYNILKIEKIKYRILANKEIVKNGCVVGNTLKSILKRL